MKYPLRTKFADEIICEFLPPKKQSSNVIILSPGLPTSPNKNSLLRFWSAKNYWVFLPRYRGSWESAGTLFEKSPHMDILDIIDGISQPFTVLGLSTSEVMEILKPEITLIGCSFGGPAVLLNSSDPRVNKIIAISPVIDWNQIGPDEPKKEFHNFVDKAFGNAYRRDKNSWDTLGKNGFYNPVDQLKGIDGSKILIIHGKKDQVTPLKPVLDFTQKTSSHLHVLSKKKHLSLGQSSKFWTYRKIKKFIKS